MLALNGPKVARVPIIEYTHINPTIAKVIKLCFFNLLFLFKYFKNGNAITKAEREPIINNEVFISSIPIPLPNTGSIYFICLYFSVTSERFIKLSIKEPEVNITKISSVVNFFPIIKNDGNRKKINIYQRKVRQTEKYRYMPEKECYHGLRKRRSDDGRRADR